MSEKIRKLLAALEPVAVDVDDTMPTNTSDAVWSIAVSLKRLADQQDVTVEAWRQSTETQREMLELQKQMLELQKLFYKLHVQASSGSFQTQGPA